MISLLLAAAVATATPAPVTSPPTYDIARDAPLVCTAHFIEEMRIISAGLKDQKALVIEVYADKAKLSPPAKMALTNFCTMFDLGAQFVVKQLQDQQQANRPHGIGHPTDKIASFSLAR